MYMFADAVDGGHSEQPGSGEHGHAGSDTPGRRATVRNCLWLEKRKRSQVEDKANRVSGRWRGLEDGTGE